MIVCVCVCVCVCCECVCVCVCVRMLGDLHVLVCFREEIDLCVTCFRLIWYLYVCVHRCLGIGVGMLFCTCSRKFSYIQIGPPK